MERFDFLAATLALTAAGQFLFKWRSIVHAGDVSGGQHGYVMAMATDFFVLSGLACALAASMFWTLAIQRTPLSIAYPFMALSFVIIPIGSVWLFDEHMSLVQIIGSTIVVLGVTVSALGH